MSGSADRGHCIDATDLCGAPFSCHVTTVNKEVSFVFEYKAPPAAVTLQVIGKPHIEI